MNETERKELIESSQLESKARRYSFIFCFPFTLAFGFWLVIDKNSPENAVYPLFLVSAMLNFLPMVLMQDVVKSILIFIRNKNN